MSALIHNKKHLVHTGQAACCAAVHWTWWFYNYQLSWLLFKNKILLDSWDILEKNRKWLGTRRSIIRQECPRVNDIMAGTKYHNVLHHDCNVLWLAKKNWNAAKYWLCSNSTRVGLAWQQREELFFNRLIQNFFYLYTSLFSTWKTWFIFYTSV